MDSAEPPRIVYESPDPCHEGERVEQTLRRALTPALAPGRGWVVSLRIEHAEGKSFRAQGEIIDATGAPVAHRAIAGATTGGDCSGLAKAVGVWAQLVLDAEVRRSSVAAMAQPGSAMAGRDARSARSSGSSTSPRTGGGAARAPGDGSSGGTTAGGTSAGGSDDAGDGAGGGNGVGAGIGDGGDAVEPGAPVTVAEATGEGVWPAPAINEKPSPEHDWYLHHDEARTLEIGAGVFLMNGTAGGALAGPTAFVVVEAGHGIFLRPSLALGQTLTSIPATAVTSATWAAARFDGCLRLPGLYTRRHGMQLDLCAGSDIGFTVLQVDPTNSTTLPYVDVGPSIGMRGELGSRLSAVLRVVGGVNLLRQSFVDQSGSGQQPPLAEARIELAASWDVR